MFRIAKIALVAALTVGCSVESTELAPSHGDAHRVAGPIISLEPSFPGSSVASCPREEVILSGGCLTVGTNTYLHASYPREDLRSWECVAIDGAGGAGGTSTVQAFVVCERLR